ncbi:MAG: VWA domain-containing protein [Campylobacteraceae bacterium]|jgi:uncharacterized protein YegL|nr:VWA domain-containing protein [Campylobacteraceae bacterium]
MRRLPVFFLLDCSESMAGDKLDKMQDALSAVVNSLRSNPYALETVYVSVIAFAGVAKTIAPLTELCSFYPPKLPLGGGTCLGLAFDTLMDEMDRRVVKTTPEQKGDWKPFVFLITDGHSTDKTDNAASRWQAKYAKRATLIAISLGKEADFTLLKKLSENVIIYEEADESRYTALIKWISDSTISQSKSIGEGVENNPLPNLDEIALKLVKEPPASVDDSCVVLLGRCQKTKKPYLIKYERAITKLGRGEYKVDVVNYDFTGAFTIDEEYFKWSQAKPSEIKVNTSLLNGAPSCPHCSAYTAFAMCGCGKLTCTSGGEAVCPWCGKELFFGGGEGGGGDFDVGRSLG